MRDYRELVKENDIERIVVGLPLYTSGREGQLAIAARTFGDWLCVSPTRRFSTSTSATSVEAEYRLLDAGLTRQRREVLRDKLAAAQIMLQGDLDAGSPRPELIAACRLLIPTRSKS